MKAEADAVECEAAASDSAQVDACWADTAAAYEQSATQAESTLKAHLQEILDAFDARLQAAARKDVAAGKKANARIYAAFEDIVPDARRYAFLQGRSVSLFKACSAG